MIKKELNAGNFRVTCVYDDTKFSIVYNQPNDLIVISSVKTGSIVKIFEPRLGFIEQVDKESKSYFVVSDYSNKKNSDQYPCSLDVYTIANPSGGEYYLFDKKTYEMNESSYEYVHVAPGVYLIGQSSLGGRFLSLDKEKLSSFYDTVFNIYDRKEDFEEKDTIYVEQVFSSHVPEIKDHVIYGIDSSTLKIKTGIYSFNQDRIIPLYTEEEIKRGYEALSLSKFDDYHLLIRGSIDDIGANTLNLAVLVPLFRKGHRNLNDEKYQNYTIKPEFVKKLGEYPIPSKKENC